MYFDLIINVSNQTNQIIIIIVEICLIVIDLYALLIRAVQLITCDFVIRISSLKPVL